MAAASAGIARRIVALTQASTALAEDRVEDAADDRLPDARRDDPARRSDARLDRLLTLALIGAAGALLGLALPLLGPALRLQLLRATLDLAFVLGGAHPGR